MRELFKRLLNDVLARLRPTPPDADTLPIFERIDAACVAAGEFRRSGGMCFETTQPAPWIQQPTR